jgi:hypothetical protein
MTVINATNDIFMAWKGEQSSAKLNARNRPKLAEMVEVRFCRGHKELFYKTTYDGDYNIFQYLKKKVKMEIPPLLREAPRGIPPEKKRDIVAKLCPFMPENRQVFWKQLGGNDVTDLVANITRFEDN